MLLESFLAEFDCMLGLNLFIFKSINKLDSSGFCTLLGDIEIGGSTLFDRLLNTLSLFSVISLAPPLFEETKSNTNYLAFGDYAVFVQC